MVGLLKAVHGLVILCERVYDDARTLRSLGIRHTFDTALGEPLSIDYDGFLSKAMVGVGNNKRWNRVRVFRNGKSIVKS